jgi:isoaspartyl peptidase/L-asparaginase-like protein (Ntn-hydrolase superfamily)
MPHTIVAGIKKMQSALDTFKDDDLEMSTSTALQVACAVVSVMEDDAAFNAGYGSMPNEECNIEMDAGVMDGINRSYGSIAILGTLSHFSVEQG